VSWCGNSRQVGGYGHVNELRSIEASAAPSNEGMQLTVKSVTPFAFAKAAPLSPAADARC
jgi:hypothetical protein